MISLSVIFLPFVGSIMSFLIIFSMHSIVTTFPLQEKDTELLKIPNYRIYNSSKRQFNCMLKWPLVFALLFIFKMCHSNTCD